MKIAIITPTLSGKGGEETVIDKIIKSKKIRLAGIEIKLIILGKTYDQKWLKDFKESVYLTNNENEIGNFLFLLRILKKENFQSVICLSRKSILYSYLIRKLTMCNYIIYSWIHFNLEYVNTRFLNLADYHLAISDGICRQLLELNLGNKSNIYKIYNPVKLSSNVITRKKNNEFIYVGRITYEGQKDIKELIDNLAHLNFNNWTLRVIGEGVDKDKCQRYLDQKYPKLKNKVFWEGWKTNTWASIQQADALILTSSYEGLPMVLLEAISRGLPCLSSSIDGPNSIIQPSINGELYKKGDKDDFSFKLSKLLKTNYDPVVMKQSISPFYINNYINKFIAILKIGERNE